MKITTTILSILSAIGGVFTAIFYVLFQQKKKENELINQKYDDMKKESESTQKENEIIKESRKDSIQEIKNNEQKKHDALNGNTLSNFDALNDILSK